MTYLAIVDWDADNRVEKYQDYLTEAEAAAHVGRVAGSFPDAFTALDPGGSFRNWLVDPVAKTVVIDPSPQVISELKRTMADAFITEGVTRITAEVPEWDSFERIALLASVWNMLGAPNSAQALARDIYLYVKTTVLPKLAPLDLAGLQAIDPTAADPFGDGAAWPS